MTDRGNYKRLVRNVLVAVTFALTIYNVLKAGDVGRWQAAAQRNRLNAEECKPQLAECQAVLRDKPKARHELDIDRPSRPCPDAISYPMPRPCSPPDE